MPGDNQYALVEPDGVVEVDLDPTFSDLYSSAYLSCLVYIPTSFKADYLAQYGSGSIISMIRTDDFNLGPHQHGGIWDWYAGGGTGDITAIDFDQWVQIEFHAIAGNTTYDIRIDGTLYTGITGAFLPATGVNWIGVQPPPTTFIGAGGGTAADDSIGVDEVCFALNNWVSQGGAVECVWAFDGADPIGDAATNYPDPPYYGDAGVGGITIPSGGGDLADACGEDPPDPPPDPIGCCADTGELSARVYIGGTEVTNVSVAGGWTPRLNRPAQGTVTIPMDSAIGDCGDLLRIEVTDGIDSCIVFHGRILQVEVDSAKDDGRVVYNAQDAMELWQYRPVRADDGDFSKPVGSNLADGTDLFATYVQAPAIMQAILANSIDTTAGGGGPPPVLAEGDLELTIGGVASGGPIMSGAPVDWPMYISELFSLFVSTGQLDGIISPINPGGGVTGRLDLYNGDYGTDRSGSVLFQYGTGAHNIDHVRWNRDMTQAVNKYQIFGGPRIESPADPAGEQHWCFNVTGDDPLLPRPPGGDVNAPYSGGDAPGSAGNPLGQRRLDSQAAYNVRMKIDIFDGYDDDCIPFFGTPGRNLYRRQWQIFSWLAAMPREVIHITPVPGTLINCFHIGDLIGIELASDVRGGISGAQRVYEYTVSWEATPSLLTLSEIQTSSDAEGSAG